MATSVRDFIIDRRFSTARWALPSVIVKIFPTYGRRKKKKQPSWPRRMQNSPAKLALVFLPRAPGRFIHGMVYTMLRVITRRLWLLSDNKVELRWGVSSSRRSILSVYSATSPFLCRPKPIRLIHDGYLRR